jgi:hypothetical protein
MERALRAARVARIAERVQRLDDGTLEMLDRLTADVVRGGDLTEMGGAPKVNRRRFLGVAAGGIVVAGMAGLAIWQWGETRQAALEGRIASQKEVIELYEKLDQVDLDSQVAHGIAAVGALLGGLQSVVGGLGEAIDAARSALTEFRSNFPSLQAGFQWVHASLNVLSQRLLSLENAVTEALELPGPITETMGGFLAEVLDQLPETAREQLRAGVERMGEFVTSVPPLIEGLHTRILEPMDGWFSSSAADGLDNWIVEPLLTGVLDPAHEAAERVHGLATAWEGQLVEPVQEAIRRRSEMREEIVRLRQEYGV